jgi:hypothetical protein
MELPLVEGWTGDIDLQLLAGGTPVNLAGMTIEMVLKDKNGVAVDAAGDVVILDPATGYIRVSLDPADLVAAATPHSVHFKVTDSGGKSVFFPSGPADTWRVAVP